MPGGRCMIATIPAATAAGPWPDKTGGEMQADRAGTLERNVRMFFAISAAIELTLNEERALLDLTHRDVVLLRVVPANAFHLGGSKLERRVAYAIPILQRMIAAMSC